MTPDFPPNPRGELEARLTAYLLGELPAHEAAAVRLAMDEDAELAQLCERLKPVIKLVRATAANPAPLATAPSAPLKLSEERRQKLLAHFKTVAPPEFVRPPRRQTSLLVPIAAAAVIALLLAALLLPSLSRSKSKAQSTSIINNLRQLEGAKQTWAMENKKSPADIPTFEDLKPYMGRGTGGFPESITGEKYVLGSLSEEPSAELDAKRARKLFPAHVLPEPPSAGPGGQRVWMSIDGELTYGPQHTAESGIGELAQQKVETINGELALPFPPPALTRPSPTTLTIVLPSGGQSADTAQSATNDLPEGSITIHAKFIDVTQVPTNNWNFDNGSPNKGWVGGVSQLPGSPKTELEAKSYTNAGKLLHGGPEWVGTLDNPMPASSTNNLFIGRYAYLASNQVNSGKADGFNLDSIKIPALSVTNSLAVNSTHSFKFDTQETEPGADRNPSQSGENKSRISLPDANPSDVKELFASTNGQIPFNNAGPADPAMNSLGNVVVNDASIERAPGDNNSLPPQHISPTLLADITLPPRRNTSLNGHNLEIVDTDATGPTARKLNQSLPPPAAQNNMLLNRANTLAQQGGSVIQFKDSVPMAGGGIGGGGGGAGDLAKADGMKQGFIDLKKEQIPIKYANASNLPTNWSGDLAFNNSSTEPASGANKSPSQPHSHVVSLATADPQEVLQILNDVVPPNALVKSASTDVSNNNALLTRSTTLKQQSQDSLNIHQNQGNAGLADGSVQGYTVSGVQTAGVDLADEFTSPSTTSGNSNITSGLRLSLGTGNAGVSNYASTPPSGSFSEFGRGNLADANQAYGFYRDVNRNGSMDQGIAQAGETTLTNTVKPVPSRPTILFRNTLQPQQNLAGPAPTKPAIADGNITNSGSLNVTDEATRRTASELAAAQKTITVAKAEPNTATIAVDQETHSVVVVADDATYEKINETIKQIDGNAGVKRDKEFAKAAPQVVKGLPLDSNGNTDPAIKKPAAPAPVPQPEVLTSENSFSTFSLNVSDVSFKLAAASLEKGVVPEPASIRSEEFINAFNYRDPDPAPGAPIGFAWERAHDPFALNRDLVRFSVKTAAAGREPGRPLNIVLLLDNSGSMERADRVQIIHEALRVLATQLQPQDKLSVVTFARTARLWVDGVSGSEAGAVAEQVGNLTPQGGTNLEEAMRLAYETARRHYLSNGVNRVVLLTDGAANLGNVEPVALKQKVEENRKQGIALDCFGIGWEGYNDDLLEVLARNGDGRYGFLNTPEEAATDFAGQLAGALRVAASDVKVQVEFNPKRVTAYRQIGYAKHQLTKKQFRDNTVNAAQIGAAESGNALYTIAVNPAGEGPLGTVRVRFRVPGASDYQEHAWELPYTGNCVSLDQASPAMRLAATASAFSESLASSPFATEVTSDQLLGYLRGVPEVYGADARPKKLEWMIRQVKSLSGK